MKKEMRYLFLLVGLLMTTTVSAYKIETVNASHGSVTPITYYDGGSHDVTVNGTDIPAHKTITMTVTPDAGYYLSSLVYEEVTPLDIALAPRRAPDIKPIHNITIPTTSAYLTTHFGGSYSFEMPENNVIITATFVECTSITSANLHWDSGDGPQSKVYDGDAHTMIVKVGDTELTRDRHYTTTAYTLTNVDNITPTITGIGEYDGSINGTTTLSITRKNLTITANSQTISYGSSIQTGVSQVNITGLVTNDGLTGITLTPSTSQITDAGTITPSAATTTKGISNYNVTYNTGLLIIQAFNLSAVDLSEDVLDIDLDHDYFNYITGTQQKAIVTSIEYQNTPLVSGTSYTYDYEAAGAYGKTDYISPDIYTIVITFYGNYTGTKRINYQIRPEITLNNSTRWRTFYESTYNMVVPASFTAHTVSAITSSAVELTPREVIKAGTPMLLYRTGDTSSGIYPELIPTSDARLADSYWTNVSPKFLHNADDWNLTGDPDIQNGTTKIMILVDDKFVRTKSGTLKAGKCYLDITGTSLGSRDLNLDDDETTNLSEEVKVNSDKLATANWYDLSGRRIGQWSMINGQLKPGLYIVNGKKIIIK